MVALRYFLIVITSLALAGMEGEEQSRNGPHRVSDRQQAGRATD